MRKTIFAMSCAAGLMLAGASQAGDVRITLEGVQARGGEVLVTLQTQGQFMQQQGLGQRIAAPAAGPLVITFTGVAPGEYALSAFHDENGDGRMAASDFGIPLEGWAMSNGDTLRGPPTFDLVKFTVGADGAVISETMHYWDGQIPGQPASR